MIIYNKRKTSDAKPFFPYVNVVLLLILFGSFVAWNLHTSASSPVVEQAQIVQQEVAQVSRVDLSGEWIGTMTEDYFSVDANEELRYDYRIVLRQSGTSISGIAYQETSNYEPEIYSESTISGDVTGTSLYFYETRVNVLENVSLDRWCRVEVTVNYELVNGLETLVGTWDSVEDERAGCSTIDGRVVLTRQQ